MACCCGGPTEADPRRAPRKSWASYLCGCCMCCMTEDTVLYKGDPVEQFFAKYEFTTQKLGSGAFSEVLKVLLLEDKSQEFAVKIVQKQRLTLKDLKHVYAEVGILQSLSNPHVVKCYGMYENDLYLYIVCEYIPGGELLTQIEARHSYSEEDAKSIVRTLVSTLEFCYKNGVVHRDLKPENVLLRSPEKPADIVLVDFGFAYQQRPELQSFKLLQTQLGTPNYVAPEILQSKAYNYKCDIWSLGVMTYILLCGQPPFYGKNRKELFFRIKRGQFEFEPAEEWENVSTEAKDFVSKVLQRDPDLRYDFNQMREHPWLEPGNVSDIDISKSLGVLSKYNAKRRLLALVTAQAAAKVFDDMMTLSEMNLEDAQLPENHIVITQTDIAGYEEKNGQIEVSRDLEEEIRKLIEEV